MTSEHTDVVVLGGGSGGYATALRTAQLGRSVVLVEQAEVGGTCLHRGCVPTKALLHAAEVADTARTGVACGVRSSYAGIDLEVFTAFKDRVVGRLHTGLRSLLDAAGVRVVAGRGRLAGPGAIDVGDQRLTAADVVLATGSRARLLPGVELGPRVVTSDGALSLSEVPRRAVVIGGSVIGVEFASAWRSLGAEVTILEALPALVPLEDPALSRLLSRAFRSRGIVARTGVRVDRVEAGRDEVVVHVDDGTMIEADLVLVAVGREPVTDGLGYEEAGVRLDRGWVATDESLRTTVPGVHAVGDLVAGLQLAHRGFAHGLFVADRLAGLDPDPVDDVTIPRVTYCDPELASVGLTEPEARARHGEVEVAEYSLAGNARSQILDTEGLVKVVRVPGGAIVGVHLGGARMGEQVGEAALLVGWEALPEDVIRFVHAHPTQNESIGEAAMVLAGRPLHAHA